MPYILICVRVPLATSDVHSSLDIPTTADEIHMEDRNHSLAWTKPNNGIYTTQNSLQTCAWTATFNLNKAKFEGQCFPICLPYLGVVFGLSTICIITVRESGTELQWSLLLREGLIKKTWPGSGLADRNRRDYGIEGKFRSGWRDWRTLLGTLFIFLSAWYWQEKFDFDHFRINGWTHTSIMDRFYG